MKTLRKSVVYFVVICIIGCTNSQSLNDLEDGELKNKLGVLSENLKPEDVEERFREKCKKNGADENVVDSLKNQTESIQKCVEQHANITVINAELEIAKKTGSMDEVFSKYCLKYPLIKSCIDAVTNTMKTCLDDKEKEALEISQNILGELQGFLCYQDGDRMAMFIAEGGVSCIQKKKEGVEYCFNKTMGGRIPTDISVSNLPVILFSDKDCSDIDEVKQCVVAELEKCENTTPANIADAFFKFLKKHLPCGKTSVDSSQVKTSANSATNAFTFLSLIMVLVIKLF